MRTVVTTHEVRVPCPNCSNDIDVEITLSGRPFHVVRGDPTAQGSVEFMTTIECESGCRLSKSQIAEIESAAERQLAEDHDTYRRYEG